MCFVVFLKFGTSKEKNPEITLGAACEHLVVGPHLSVALAIGCNHNPTSQKRC
jgi:hypothetical protein